MLIIVSWIPRGKSAGENHLPTCTGTTGERRRRGPALDHVEIRISPWPQERMSSAYRNKVMDCWLKASQEYSVRQEAPSEASQRGVEHLPWAGKICPFSLLPASINGEQNKAGRLHGLEP